VYVCMDVYVLEFGFFLLAMILSFFYNRFISVLSARWRCIKRCDASWMLKMIRNKTSVVSTMRINIPSIIIFASIAFWRTRGEIRERKIMKSLSVEQNERKSGRYIEVSLKGIIRENTEISISTLSSCTKCTIDLHYGIDSPTNEWINN